MKNQTGARFIKRQKAQLLDKEVVCTCHVKRESELVRLPNGNVKRKNKNVEPL